MTHRERFVRALRFQEVDCVPLDPGGGRVSTRIAWRRQGLPEGVENIQEYAYCQVGGLREWPPDEVRFPVNERMIPMFEEKVLERGERSQIVQDWKGNICEISNEYTTEYLRNAIDFVTRRWIKCPVESRSDWEDLKRRYDADEPSRLPIDAQSQGSRLSGRETPLALNFSGPFWQLREWLGFESLCMLFHDDPDWVKEMISFWEDYLAAVLKRVLQCVVPDLICISEDMAFKRFPMISPAMAREFLLPTYQRWGNIILEAGCPLFAIDSDGFVGDLIPVWIEGGVNVCMPMEVAAGNDLLDLRRRFGKAMAFHGGVDKRIIAKGGEDLEAHLDHLESVIQDGGYIPSCDHAVPADVSWPSYLHYVKVLARKTGWL